MTADRTYWLDLLLKTSEPVFHHLSRHTLRASMTVEQHPDASGRRTVTYLEAAGRSLAGIAPWLERPSDHPEEEQRRRSLLASVQAGLTNLSDPDSPDAVDFSSAPQILVDTAFLCHGLLRGWDSVWTPLNSDVKDRLLERMALTRSFPAPECNWLLFSAMVEAFCHRAGADWRPEVIQKALDRHERWYKGDGVYGDGEDFHWDYYNSFVIQPMLLDVLRECAAEKEQWEKARNICLNRSRRYAAIQEKLISRTGEFPPLGRSLTYRFGVFQLLGQMALMHELPAELHPAAVRGAMTAALRCCMDPEKTFNRQGWLQIGLCGHQPSLGEIYISTGSLYLTLCGFLPLGLPVEDPFWSDPEEAWTAVKIWGGQDHPSDHAYRES